MTGSVPLVVNARFLTQRVTGVQRYAIEVSRRLRRARPDIRFLAPTGIVHADLARELGAEETGRLRGHAWEQAELPRLLGGAGLINLCNAAPVAVRRQLVVIHDTAPFAVPEAFGRSFRLWYRFMTRQAARRARAVVTVSDFSRDEIHRYLGVAADKITVLHEGWEHIAAVEADPSVVARHGLGDRPFLLAVGSRSPHKNFALLVRAADELGDRPFRIVVAGGVDPRVHAAFPDALAHDRFRHVGAVSDGELRALYETAAGYIHPAYYEGFGLPPLEAMALGCPVLMARAAALPEVGGDAVRLFDPFDPHDLAGAIDRLMGDADLRATLSADGRRRAATFSWDRCAAGVLATAEARLG